MGYLSQEQLEQVGFASLGKNVSISDKASIYGANRIHIGNQVRIDDFCLLSAGPGGIQIGNYVHIAVGSLLIGAEKITMSDFSGLSSKVSIYSSSDDYSGEYLTNPTVPSGFTNVKNSPVSLEMHVIVGSGSVILPGVTLRKGVAVGALSLIAKDCAEFSIYAGNPARKIGERKQNLLSLEKQLLQVNHN